MPKVKYCVTEFTPTANLLSPLWQGGGYKAGVLRRAKRQSRAEMRLAA